MKYVWLFVVTSLLIDVIAFLVFVNSSSTVGDYLFNEDNLIENLSAGLFFCTFLFALMLLITRHLRNRFHRRWLILLLALGLIGFLDEISFGERLFNFDMPVLDGTKIDAVHDFFELGQSRIHRLITHHLLLVLLFILSGLILSMIAILKYGQRFWDSAIADRNQPLYLVMFFFIVLIFSALILDAGLLSFGHFRAVEELFELNAALALLTSCFVIYKLDTV